MLNPDQERLLSELFPNIATQLRGALANLHLAAASLAPADQRERDPALDARAAIFDQSYYQILRLVSNLNATITFAEDAPLPVQDLDVVQIVRDHCEACFFLAKLKQIELRFLCREASHISAVNQQALTLVLQQLLSNALKFTKEGHITVELRFSNGRMRLSVADTGCGISDELFPTLFDRYAHADLINPPPHGLGLGLPLCRRIADRLGGTIMAESRAGIGTKITCSFPDTRCGVLAVHEPGVDYAGGFNPTLQGLADALPQEAFLLRSQE